jgi:hypothetical protein
MDDPILPTADRKTRLVLLVVDPHLIHAYWKIAPARLPDVRKKAALGSVVLRFYRENQESFDVDIDLQSHGWYVRLWSQEESLYADLAIKMVDGTLTRLARSKVVHLPRTRPVIAIEQHFMRVDAAERRAELVPPPRPLPSSPPPPQIAVPIAAPMDYGEIVREKLKEVYGSVTWHPADFHSENEPATDLTAIAEESLTPGLSSGELQPSRPEDEPEEKK